MQRANPIEGRMTLTETKNATRTNMKPAIAEILKGVSKKRYLEVIKSFEGQDYCWPTAENKWSGKGYETSLYPNTKDCSGTVTAGLFGASDGQLDMRNTHNAQALSELGEDADGGPVEGDLAFYGKDGHITHVMTVVSDGRVFGASGGDSRTTTPEIAKKMNANVRYQSSVLYRKDLACIKRIFTKE